MDYYTQQKYYFENIDELYRATAWLRKNKIKNWVKLAHHDPNNPNLNFKIIVNYNYTELNIMTMAELNFR